MNKYITVFKTSFKQESKTIVNSLMVLVSYAVIIYIFSGLWGFIYGESGSGQIINGYTLGAMIWYLIVAESITFSAVNRKVAKVISHEIKSGKVAYSLNKPYNFFIYQITDGFSKSVWKLLFVLSAGILMGLVLAGPVNITIFNVFPIIFSILLSILLNTLFFGLFGVLAFWLEDSISLTWIGQKFLMILGMFFPVEFFPAWLQPVILYSPIYSIYTGPCKLFANFSWELFGQITASQIAYLLLFVGLGLWLFKLGSKKVNINGG